MATFHLKECLSITHKSEPVGTFILVVKILGTDIIDELFVVDNTTRVHRRDLAVDCPTLIPGSTPTGPDCSLQELLDVDVVLVQHIRLDRE